MPAHSQLVCRNCRRKIRNVAETYAFIRDSLTKEKDNVVATNTANTLTPTRSKRCLPRTKTPVRSLPKIADVQNRQHTSSSKKLRFDSGVDYSVENEDQGVATHAISEPIVSPTILDDELNNLYNIKSS